MNNSRRTMYKKYTRNTVIFFRDRYRVSSHKPVRQFSAPEVHPVYLQSLHASIFAQAVDKENFHADSPVKTWIAKYASLRGSSGGTLAHKCKALSRHTERSSVNEKKQTKNKGMSPPHPTTAHQNTTAWYPTASYAPPSNLSAWTALQK